MHTFQIRFSQIVVFIVFENCIKARIVTRFFLKESFFLHVSKSIDVLLFVLLLSIEI